MKGQDLSLEERRLACQGTEKKFNIIIAENVPDLGGRCLSIKRKHLEDQLDNIRK